LLIDLHNHVLPGIDDGSPNLEVSMNMIRTASEQGITDIVNTVHFQHPKMDMIPITMDDITLRVGELQREIDSAELNVRLHIGAEVFFLPNLLELKENPLCTFGNGRYMLIEFQMRNLPDIHRETLFDLKMAGVTPIIAHPERYEQVQNNIHVVHQWIKAGCLMQIDAGSLNGTLGKSAQKSAIEITQNRMCHLIGSDAHNDGRRNFCLKTALEHVTVLTDESFSDMLIQNADKVLKGQYIEQDFIIVEPTKRNLLSKLKSKIWSPIDIQ
jgi:protein-tyrosine phosphatase